HSGLHNGNHSKMIVAACFLFLLSFSLAGEIAEEIPPELVGIDQCTLKCKDNHMSKHMDSEWSSSFTLPILNLLRRTGNLSAAYAKVHMICLEDQAFDDCLSKCNSTLEAEIIRLGLNSFRDACESKRLESQLGCWKAHTNEIETNCLEYTNRLRRRMEMLSVNQSMAIVGDVCSEYVRFSGCLEAEFSKHCGYESALLTRKMSERSRKSIFQMLTLKFKSLPTSCSPSTAYRRDVTSDYLTGTGLFYGSGSSTVFHISSIIVAFVLQ
ncbi:hypothetical protein PFISCL1PPCAC_4006, partial [Pristionchus fissidentatus]